MSAHHQPESVQSLYEGDQSKLYSGWLHPHEDVKSTNSKKKIRNIWMITLYLSILTIVEVGMGLTEYFYGDHLNRTMMITLFMFLTLVKAYLIVKIFMHLGDETKFFARTVILPLILLLWVIVAYLYEGNYWLRMNKTTAGAVKIEQKK